MAESKQHILVSIILMFDHHVLFSSECINIDETSLSFTFTIRFRD